MNINTELKKTFVQEITKIKDERVASLANFYNEFYNHSTFIDLLIELINEKPDLENPISWMLKEFVKRKGSYSLKQTKLLVSPIINRRHWVAKLQMLYLIPFLELDKEMAMLLEPYLFKELKSSNGFVRATAFEAYDCIVDLFPEIEGEFIDICQVAFERDKAAVKHKAKNILKKRGKF